MSKIKLCLILAFACLRRQGFGTLAFVGYWIFGLGYLIWVYYPHDRISKTAAYYIGQPFYFYPVLLQCI